MSRVQLMSGVAIPAGSGTPYTTNPVSGLAGIAQITTLFKFVRTSGGTTIEAWLQTSVDGGATWIDIACAAFATTSLSKLFSNSAGGLDTQASAPTDGSLADDTIFDGVIGDMFRVKYLVTGTYVGTLSVFLSAKASGGAGGSGSGGSAGTEYTEGATDASITGVAFMWEDAGDTLRAVSAAKPLPAEIVAGTISLTGEDHLGEVGGSTPTIRPTIAVETTPDYVANDVVGGEIALTNAMRVSGGTGVLGSITLSDATNTKPELDLVFFESNPAGTYTDNAAFPNGDTDNAIRLGYVHIATTDWITFGDGACVTKSVVGIGLYANGSATPYLVIVTRTGINFAATDDLVAAISVLQD